MRHGFVFLFAIVIIITQCDSLRILGLFPLPIKSHYIVFEKLMKGLVKKGHEVHVVNHFPQKDIVPKYYDIDIQGSLPWVTNVSIESYLGLGKGIWGSAFHVFRTCGSDICEHIFKQPSVIKLKDSKLSFDLIIAEIYGTDCMLGFANLFKTPIVGISSTDLLPWASVRMGNPDNPSYVPNYFLAKNDKMIIYEKAQMVMASLLSKIGYFFLSTIPSEMRAREFFGNNYPPIDKIMYNTSMLLLNTHFTVTDARPMVPGVVEVGGLHIEKPRPLSPDLENLVWSTEHGIIYFSMGTVINMETVPRAKLQALINAFSKLPQVVLWGGINDHIPLAIPKNVHILPMTSQIDILCHQNLKVFVTHGGLMSIQEAAYCGVPILGIAVFPNQKRNVVKYVASGAGISLEYDDVTMENVLDSIRNLTKNDTYQERARQLSQIFKDRPMAPLDTAIYWIEYVVRYGGATHMRSKAADLIWFEYYLIDVIIITVALSILFFIMFGLLIEFLQNYFDNYYYYNRLFYFSDRKHK